MHELSMAQSLVDVACSQLERSGWRPGAERVSAVHVRVGALSGVVADALVSAYDIAIQGTELEGSKLVAEMTDLVVWCDTCRSEQTLSDFVRKCPVCGSATPQVVRGTELELASIEVIDATANRGSSTTHTEAK